MSTSDSKDDATRERRVWVTPCLTKHDSLTALTQQKYPQQPYSKEDSLIAGIEAIPCSQGFCP